MAVSKSVVIRTEWWLAQTVDPSTYVYNPQFDLGIEEEWLPKYPVIKPRTATQPTSAILWMWHDGDNDDNDEFQSSFGAMKDPRYCNIVAEFNVTSEGLRFLIQSKIAIIQQINMSAITDLRIKRMPLQLRMRNNITS